MIASECAPAAKVGGMGDVVQGLSHELALRGNSVEIILPKYDCLRYDRIRELQRVYDALWVPFHGQHIRCQVYFGFADGLKCFFIEPHSCQNFFHRGIYYGHQDDPERFAFFSRAALEFMWATNKHPDVIHCHDWQTGLIPVLLFDLYKYRGMTHSRVCYTLHNVRHQGVTGEFILRQVGLNPSYYMSPDRLLDNFNPYAVNLMKGGIVYSNFVTTVSPRYAREIKHTELGCGLQHTLWLHEVKFGGVRNGIDYNVWNPEIDPLIAHRYSPDSIDYKYRNKEALRHRFWLRQDFKPLIAVIGRLDHQKGVELIRHAIFYSLANRAQFVLLGSSADPGINSEFLGLKHYLNDNPDCHLEISYDEELAHLIYAGADMIAVPSTFEPCGLTQLIAMKYGTIPIVRNTGGLADTVFDADYSNKPYLERNGYVFNDYDQQGLESAMRRAIGLWYDYAHYFRELMLNCMRYDYCWNYPAQDYLNIYNYIAG
jgi:starch synthase